jgi:hypothetical protein
MNPGPILIIRNTFPTLPYVFLFLVIINSENTKNIFTFCNYTENPIVFLLYDSSLVLLSVIYFLLFYFILLDLLI